MSVSTHYDEDVGKFSFKCKVAFLKKVTCGEIAIFNRVLKVTRDCFIFAVLCSVIGPENLRHSLDQSDAKVNQITRVFPHFRQFSRFSFEFSLAVKGIFLSSDWPIWSPRFWFTTLQRKALWLCVVLCGRSRVIIDTMILWRWHLNLARWVSFRVKQNKISFVRACKIIAWNISRGLDQRLQTVVEQFTSGLSTVSRQRIDLLPIIYRRFIEDYWLSNDLLILFYALFYFYSFRLL